MEYSLIVFFAFLCGYSAAGMFMIGETGLYYEHCLPVKREEIEFVK